MIVFGLFFGLVFLPVILSLLGPSEWQSHSTNEYEATQTSDSRRRRTNKQDDFHVNDKEMISFIQSNGNDRMDEKT